jgi:2-hydroxychromene-2-carboxylate isomerase
VVSVPETQPIFYYDFGDPLCYLAAERVMPELPVVAEWEPVLASAIGIEPAQIEREALERAAARRRLQPLRWPPSWPPDPRVAALAATYAKHIGRVVAFSLACFRQTFAGGRDPGSEETVLIAAAACEMHPTAVLRGIELRSVREGLAAAGDRAKRGGVRRLPAIAVGERLFQGEEAVEQAVRGLGALV